MLLCSSTLVWAQSNKQPSKLKTGLWNPWTSAEVGIVWGSLEPNSEFRLQGGVSKNGWKLGAGIAHDNYRFQSMPMYLQVRKIFTDGKRRPFMLVSAGYNFSTESDYTPEWFNTWGGGQIRYEYSSGVYGEFGAGYAFRAHKKWGYTLSLSYTYKSMTENVNSTIWNGVTNELSRTQSIYRMNRLAIRLGIQIGK